MWSNVEVFVRPYPVSAPEKSALTAMNRNSGYEPGATDVLIRSWKRTTFNTTDRGECRKLASLPLRSGQYSFSAHRIILVFGSGAGRQRDSPPIHID